MSEHSGDYVPPDYRETLVRSIVASGVNRMAAEETADGILRARHMLARQDEAYRSGPSGSWLQRWVPGVCRHERVRCTHGDEIIGRRYRRRVCLVCGRSLKGPLPAECYFTGAPHSGSTAGGNDG